MRYATCQTTDGARGAVLDGDELVLLDHPDAAAAAAVQARPGAGASSVPVADARLASPSTRPGKVICVGLNYETHIREMGRELPSHPTLFTKFARTLTGPYDDIPLPPESDQVDWEAELALVIGREVRRATPTDALACISGYTVANDVTLRDWQRRTKQWMAGKAWERSTPVGPVLVTPDEVDHAADLAVECHVDDEQVQQARTSDLVFGPADLVAYVSTIVTLEPGDLILTGTPGGVGAGRQPQRFLTPGCTVETSIEGLGQLRNLCVPEEG